jgi:acylphosphatase
LDRVTRRWLVFGKVQGVFFRNSTRAEARKLSIRGIARNLADGSVEVLAHGERDALEQLRAWLHQGPRHARVDEVRELACEDLAPPLPGEFEIS